MSRSERILVVYLYDQEDPVSENNMNFFVKKALDGHDGCDFVFIVRGAGNAQVKSLHKSFCNTQKPCPQILTVWLKMWSK